MSEKREATRGRGLRRKARPGRRWAGLCALAPVLLASPPAGAQLAIGSCDAATRDIVEGFVGRFGALMEARSSLDEEAFARRVRAEIGETIAIGEVAPKILGDRWTGLGPRQRAEFAEVLQTSIGKLLLSFLEENADGGLPTVEPTGVQQKRGETVFSYSVVTGGGSAKPLTITVGAPEGEACQIVDLEYDRDGLVDTYHDLAVDLIDDYSFEYMIASVGDRPAMVLEDFESSPVGELPVGWTWRKGDRDKVKPYWVREVDGNRYLEARDEGQSVILGKEIRWNLEEYPYISFRVRVNQIPVGADERYDDTVDSAAGLYVTYKKKMLGKIPESVKFVWSSTLPVGSATIRQGIGRPWQVVFGSGEEGLGEWRTYVFDLREAYRRTFGGGPGDRPLGVGILSDANSVHSLAYADYDDIRVLRTAGPEVDGGVQERLRPRRRRR